MKNGTYIVQVERLDDRGVDMGISYEVLYCEDGFWENPGYKCAILVETAKLLTEKDLRGQL